MEKALIQKLDLSFIDISSYLGLAAIGVMTINLVLGLLISLQYSPTHSWPHRHIPLSNLHKCSGYSAVLLVLLHPAILPFTTVVKFTVWDVLLPINAPVQPVVYTIGAASLYLLVFVCVTAFFRSRFKYASWKKLHYASYAVIILFTIHGVLANPTIKEDVPIDWLDAGKIFVEVCALLCTALLIWRITGGRTARCNMLQLQAQATAKAWRGTLRVDAVVDTGLNVKTFRLVHPDNKILPFEFKPGQYLTFRISLGGEKLFRSYSISSSPSERHYCEISVKRINGGVGSTFFHSSIEPNSQLECSGAHGKFIFTGDESNKLFLIGGGIGVTPLMSMLKQLAFTQWQHEVFLLFAVRTPDQIIFRQELDTIQRKLPGFRLMVLPTELSEAPWVGPSGLINDDLVNLLVPDVAGCRIYICGPKPMMEAATTLLTGLGVQQNQILTELFTSGGAAADDPSAVDATIVFSKSHKETVLPAGGTLLEAAESLSVPVDFACRVGSCGTCKVKVVSGKTMMRVDDCLSSREIREGIVLACQAVPQSSNVIVEY